MAPAEAGPAARAPPGQQQLRAQQAKMPMETVTTTPPAAPTAMNSVESAAALGWGEGEGEAPATRVGAATVPDGARLALQEPVPEAATDGLPDAVGDGLAPRDRLPEAVTDGLPDAVGDGLAPLDRLSDAVTDADAVSDGLAPLVRLPEADLESETAGGPAPDAVPEPLSVGVPLRVTVAVAERVGVAVLVLVNTGVPAPVPVPDAEPVPDAVGDGLAPLVRLAEVEPVAEGATDAVPLLVVADAMGPGETTPVVGDAGDACTVAEDASVPLADDEMLGLRVSAAVAVAVAVSDTEPPALTLALRAVVGEPEVMAVPELAALGVGGLLALELLPA